MVELSDRYVVTSNWESGFGRYNIMLEPRRISVGSVMDSTARDTIADDPATGSAAAGDDAVNIEFKVQDEEEKELSETVQDALRQIEEKDYQATLLARGIPQERIRKYGFAFCGKKVLIGAGGGKR